MHDVDAIVIGSGAGGLAAALSLARAGRTVKVLEQHYVPGGWCHSFQLGGYHFSPGVHYVGELGPEGRLRKIYEGLGVSGDVEFFELDPDGYDVVQVDRRRFRYCKGKGALTARFAQEFPRQAQAVGRYLDGIERLDAQLKALLRLRGLRDVLALPFRAPSLLRHGGSTVSKYMDRCGLTDPVLRGILGAQCGDYALPPERAPMPLHAGVAAHYFDGGWYPRGGGMAIPRAFVRALKRLGSSIELRARVERILVEGRGSRRRAIGVRLADGRELRAPWVISNADPQVTWDLVGVEHTPRPLLRRLARTTWSVSVVSLFVAARLDLRQAGLTSGNVWWSRDPQIDRHYRDALRRPLDRSWEPDALFLTATSLKDPTKARDGVHTLEAFALVPWEPFAPWAKTDPEARPPAYEALKERLQVGLLRAVERIVPGLSERVVFSDVGTPLTNAHFVNATRGSIYGTEKRFGQLGPLGYGLTTPIKGLNQCGASTISHGVIGATMSGIACARTIAGCSTRELLNAEGPPLQTYQAEDAATWPERLRRSIALHA